MCRLGECSRWSIVSGHSQLVGAVSKDDDTYDAFENYLGRVVCRAELHCGMCTHIHMGTGHDQYFVCRV